MTWHHEDCEGQCLACLIQEIVKQTYGNQGLAYLLRNVEQQTNEYICKCGLRVSPHRCKTGVFLSILTTHGILFINIYNETS